MMVSLFENRFLFRSLALNFLVLFSSLNSMNRFLKSTVETVRPSTQIMWSCSLFKIPFLQLSLIFCYADLRSLFYQHKNVENYIYLSSLNRNLPDNARNHRARLMNAKEREFKLHIAVAMKLVPIELVCIMLVAGPRRLE